MPEAVAVRYETVVSDKITLAGVPQRSSMETPPVRQGGVWRGFNAAASRVSLPRRPLRRPSAFEL